MSDLLAIEGGAVAIRSIVAVDTVTNEPPNPVWGTEYLAVRVHLAGGQTLTAARVQSKTLGGAYREANGHVDAIIDMIRDQAITARGGRNHPGSCPRLLNLNGEEIEL